MANCQEQGSIWHCAQFEALRKELLPVRRQSVLVIGIALVAAATFGFGIGVLAQTPLQRLADERVNISRMDWVLLNTRVFVLEQTLKNDLSLPINPTDFSYDSEKQKIRIAVSIDPVWLASKSSGQVTRDLETRATSLCVAPALADKSLTMAIGAGIAPKQYCSIRFFTLGLGKDGKVEPRDVALFEDGKIILK